MGNERVTLPVADIENKVLGAGDTDFFDSDLSPSISQGLGTIFTIHFAFSVDAVISYTLDGTNFYSILNGDFAQGDSGHMFQITLKEGDLFNIHASVPGTVRFCRVDLV